MGNEESAPGRQGQASRLSKEEHERLEGERYVIFPHMVAVGPVDVGEDDAASAGDGAKAGEAEEETEAGATRAAGRGDGDEGDDGVRAVKWADEAEGARAASRPPLPPPPKCRTRLPSWAAMAEVLQRDITDLATLHRALGEIKPGPPPLVTGFKGIFGREPAFEPRFFSAILPTIQRLALKLPEVFPLEQRLTLLVPKQDGEVTLTQWTQVLVMRPTDVEQCAVLLASSFMGTLWVHPVVYSPFKWPRFDVQDLFTNRQGPSVAILRMILHYFERLSIEVPQGKVTFRRQVLEQPPDWANSTKRLLPVRVSNSGKIEDSDTPLHADFANQYIGGGVLHGGCVQEEILFAIKPECLVSMLFCAKMNDNEVIFITGAERFSDYRGYGHSLEFSGNYIDRTPRDEQGSIVTTIVAVDAVVAFGGVQWKEKAIKRDLNKLYCACWEPKRKSGQALPAFATGNWGCGAFGGDKSLKVLQQLLASSEADREVLYHTFGEDYDRTSLKAGLSCDVGEHSQEWLRRINKIIADHRPTVGEVYNVLMSGAGGAHDVPGRKYNNLFELLLTHYPEATEEATEERDHEAKHEE